ncbi:MAG: CHAT domain-containing protein, partial [Acidobacteriota bacterium]
GAKPYSILHLATHGVLDTRRPELSSLLFSRLDSEGRPIDGHLRLFDIYHLQLDAELVVLSACRTALGREIRGDGLQSLARGFLHAGARRVVVSLWNVDDEATAVLMEHFYRKLLQDGQSAGAALRSARARVASDPRWQAPYYWAGFVLQGDWR